MAGFETGRAAPLTVGGEDARAVFPAECLLNALSATQADGTPRTFRRNGDVPKVDVRDPLEAHRNLLPTYTDKDIHDLTAYLAGVK